MGNKHEEDIVGELYKITAQIRVKDPVTGKIMSNEKIEELKREFYSILFKSLRETESVEFIKRLESIQRYFSNKYTKTMSILMIINKGGY